jgi:hypothetical protein
MPRRFRGRSLPTAPIDPRLERVREQARNRQRRFHVRQRLKANALRDSATLHATRLQDRFDSKDRALSAQRAELAKSTQQLFVCGICLEQMPDDSIARPDPCGHTFCRECLREHVTVRLDERRFPILCPTCAASKGKGKGVNGGTCHERMFSSLSSHYVSLRGLTASCPGPRT